MGNVYKVLVRKPEANVLPKRTRHMCENDIKIGLREIRFEFVD
jgi:hypothetical protein